MLSPDTHHSGVPNAGSGFTPCLCERRAWDQGRPAGDHPKAADKGIILFACNDLYYWRFGITTLLSLEQQEPGAQMHLHLCKPSAETLVNIDKLVRALSQIRLTWTIDDCRLAARLRFPTVYLAAVRFLIARDIGEKTRCPVLCLDIDAIAVRPVWAVYDDVRSGGDIVLIQRPERKQATRKILASAVGFNPTPAGLQFASSLARSLAAAFAPPPLYHVDQMLIFYVMREMVKRGAPSVADMRQAMADSTFGKDAVFWMPKGWAQKNAPPYTDAKRAVDTCFPDVAHVPHG